MGAQGSNGPQPWVQFQARTLFLRVPADDWIYVKRGHKSEFRAARGVASKFWSVELPAAVVAYRHTKTLGYDSSLMILEAAWQEPLGAISRESLRNEGYETLAEYRKYWLEREHHRFTPTRLTFVYRVRLFQPEDRETMALRLFDKLYQEHL